MANTLERQIVLDGWRNCVVKLTGTIDTSDAFVAPALRLTDLVNNEVRATLYAFRVDECQWSVSPGLSLVLEWNSGNPQQILALSGSREICAEEQGGFIPDVTKGGFDGAINLRTLSYAPGTIGTYSVVLECVKMYR